MQREEDMSLIPLTPGNERNHHEREKRIALSQACLSRSGHQGGDRPALKMKQATDSETHTHMAMQSMKGACHAATHITQKSGQILRPNQARPTRNAKVRPGMCCQILSGMSVNGKCQ